MKKILFTLVTMLGMATGMNAQNLQVSAAFDENAGIDSAEPVLTVNVKADFDIVAWQFDLALPEGLTTSAKNCTLNEDILPLYYNEDEEEDVLVDASFGCKKQNDGSYLMTCYWQPVLKLKAQEGKLLTVKLKVKEGFDPAGKSIVIKNAAATSEARETVKAADFTLSLDSTPSLEINSMEIVGTFPGMTWNPGEGVAMTQDPDNAAIWSVTMEGVQVEGIKYEYKATANGKWGDYELPASGNNDFTFGTNEYPAGKYNLTFTANTEEHTLNLVADQQAEVQLFELLTLNGDAAYAKDMFFLIEAANEASATIVLKAGDTEVSEIMEDGSVFIQIPNAAFATGEFTIYADKQIELTKVSLFANPDAANGIQIWPAQEQHVEINSMELYGTFPGLSWDKGLSMTKSESNPAIWSVTLTGVALEGIQYEYKVSANGVWGQYQLPADDSNQNWIFGTDMYPAGTYNLTFTADTENHVLSLTPEKVEEQGDKFELFIDKEKLDFTVADPTIVVNMKANFDVVAWQFDLVLPDGLTTSAKNCTLNEDILPLYYNEDEEEDVVVDASFGCKKQNDGSYLMTCYWQPVLKLNAQQGELLTIKLKVKEGFDATDKSIIIKNAAATSEARETVKMDLDYVLVLSNPVVGIDEVKAETNMKAVMYNVQGQRINAPVKGIVIMNGKKMFVK